MKGGGTCRAGHRAVISKEGVGTVASQMSLERAGIAFQLRRKAAPEIARNLRSPPEGAQPLKVKSFLPAGVTSASIRRATSTYVESFAIRPCSEPSLAPPSWRNFV